LQWSMTDGDAPVYRATEWQRRTLYRQPSS